MLWNARYECGIPTVDDQHKELFRQVAILMDHSQKERIPQTLDFLGQYVVKHFATEEAMQRRSNYPKAEKHQQIHRDFVNAYKELKKEYDTAGHKLAVVMKINRVAVGWLKEHIMGHDQEFARFYRQATGGGTGVIGSQPQSGFTSAGTRQVGTPPGTTVPGTLRFGASTGSPTRILGTPTRTSDSPTRILGTPGKTPESPTTRRYGAQVPATGSPTRALGSPPRQADGGTTRLIGQGTASGSAPSMWNNNLLCGISSVDEQHMELFRQVEILLDRNNRDPNRIATTLDYLGQYVVEHFATEEAMHRRSNYPKAESHRQVHRDFVNTYKELKREFDSSGRNLQTVLKINKAAVAWLREHIMGQDKDFARFYNRSAS